MDRTFFRIDRVDDDAYAVHIDGDGVPVVFADRADALAAAIDIAKAKWSFAGQPIAISYPLATSGTDVLLFGETRDDADQ